MDFYFQGFLITSLLLIIEHLALYARLKPRGDASDTWRVLVKFFLGTLAILIGTGAIAWQTHEPIAVLAPAACALGGMVVAAGYAVRWLYGQATRSAYIRGRIHGVADKADIAAEDRNVQ